MRVLITTQGERGWLYGDVVQRLRHASTDEVEVTCSLDAKDAKDVDVYHFFDPEAANQPWVTPDVLKRSVVTIQSWDDRRRSRSLNGRRKVLEQAAAVVSVNTSYIDALSNAGVRHDVTWIPYAVDTERFTPNGESSGPYAGGVDVFSDERIVLGVSGRLYPMNTKGEEQVLELAASMRDEVFLVLVGQRWETITDKLKAAGVPHAYYERDGRGTVTGIPVTYPTDYPALYRMLDVYLVASIRDGAPVAPLEAWACGVPVVSTPVGAMLDLCRRNVNGSIVPFKDGVLDVNLAKQEVTRWASKPTSPSTIASTVSFLTWDWWGSQYVKTYRRVAEGV